MKFENSLMESYFKQICKIIKVKYKNSDFDDPNWFKKHKWNQKQEQKAEDWLWKQLKSSKKNQINFCSNALSEDELKKEISLFVYDYGWTPETYPLVYKKFKLDTHIEKEN